MHVDYIRFSKIEESVYKSSGEVKGKGIKSLHKGRSFET
jgi:hypothetical protein